MNSIEIIILLGFDVANMESVNKARVQTRIPIYELHQHILNIFFCILNIYEMIQFFMYL